MSDTPMLAALREIYHTRCAVCAHVAVRTRSDGTLVCDWCVITESERRSQALGITRTMVEHYLRDLTEPKATAP